MKIKSAKTLLISAVLGCMTLGSVALAAGGNSDHKMEHQNWGFNGMFGSYDRAAMQRGYQVYREVCAACHALEHLSFRHLGDKGGPFYSKEYPNPNDNPVVKALAKDWTIEDIDQETGDIIERTAIPADKFPPIFPNEPAARASNGGALPPDLSVITKARPGGADYIYDLLMSYGDMPADFHLDPGMSYNPAFANSQIAMAPPLPDDIIEYAPTVVSDGHGGTKTIPAPPATTEQMSRDVTEFLSWSADPKLEARKRMGLAVLLYLLIFTALLYATYKTVWRNVKH